MNSPKIISVIGPSGLFCTREIYDFGVQLGKALVDNDYFVACGGLDGMMEAVCKGARQSEKYSFGCTIGILPYLEKEKANPFCDIVIPTGIGWARNQIVVAAGDAVVAVAGGSGTLSELAFAWQMGKKIICYTGFEGWSKELAQKEIDSRRREPILKADTLEEILQLLK